jgi:hypothetical protein
MEPEKSVMNKHSGNVGYSSRTERAFVRIVFFRDGARLQHNEHAFLLV